MYRAKMISFAAAITATLAVRAAATGYGYGDDDPTTAPPLATPPATPPPNLTPPPAAAGCGATDSFEGADPLAAWSLAVEDGDITPPIAVFCTGDLGGAPADYGNDFFPGRVNTFTDVVDEAADGECALRVRAGCVFGYDDTSYDYSLSFTNAAARTFTVTNGPACGGATSGFTLSVAVTYDVKDQYSAEYLDFYGLIPYLINSPGDNGAVSATVGGVDVPVAMVTSEDSITVYEGGGGITEVFVLFTADLGDVAPGESIEVVVTVSATGGGRCGPNDVFDASVIVVDDIRIEPRT